MSVTPLAWIVHRYESFLKIVLAVIIYRRSRSLNFEDTYNKGFSRLPKSLLFEIVNFDQLFQDPGKFLGQVLKEAQNLPSRYRYITGYHRCYGQCTSMWFRKCVSVVDSILLRGTFVLSVLANLVASAGDYPSLPKAV